MARNILQWEIIALLNFTITFHTMIKSTRVPTYSELMGPFKAICMSVYSSHGFVTSSLIKK